MSYYSCGLFYPKHMFTFRTPTFAFYAKLEFSFCLGFFDESVQSKTWQFEFYAHTNSQHNSFEVMNIQIIISYVT